MRVAVGLFWRWEVEEHFSFLSVGADEQLCLKQHQRMLYKLEVEYLGYEEPEGVGINQLAEQGVMLPSLYVICLSYDTE